MSIANLETLYAAAIAADESEDYATAAQKARAILVRLGTTPNVTRGLGNGSQALTFPGGETIEAFLNRVSRLAKSASVASSGPFGISKVTYARPSDG